jgi:4-hydroxy-tetrahydrodipicolinate reductase
MRHETVKVVIWGFGAMGSGMAKMIHNKIGFQIVGICDRNPEIVGKSMYELLKISKPKKDIIIQPNIENVVKKGECEIVILATDSFTKKAYPKIEWLIRQGVNVISTAEEMAYPKANEPDLALKMDVLAKEYGVTVLGTGVNPGMMMDLLVVALTGVMESVDKIEVSRINSLSPFGKTVMEEQGVGMNVSEFKHKMELGTLAGHVGFKESVGMISDALGWNVTDFKQTMMPIITDIDRQSAYGFAAKGDVAGVDMNATAWVDNQPVLNLHHPQQIEPELAGVLTGDYIDIEGNPPIHMSIKPEVNGGVGTIAICVNMIPHVINAKPGLKTMIDLPVPRAILGDVRQMIEEE